MQELIDLKNKLVDARNASDAAYENYIATEQGGIATAKNEWNEYSEATRPERQITDELIAEIERIDTRRSEG